ncbi:Holliday junction resolvase RuvX [Thermovenabulum gondwanense]|uniref:Putative pre-16S rRNA nuclease n=1 Tax=Thermovenabulum gondwanense TaxID=520767 RepID=A0A162M4E1_9FIRM|nr:Holliday junction resolvase RuvX [Thermovenabulum gondwanense]KYO63952.1 putative Holliday junction resolvase [Thermovenabulum gondwanense]
MRVLGLDVGEKRIGIAISDELGITSRGLMVLERKGFNEDVKKVVEIAEQNSVDKIVIGLPVNMNGTYGKGVENVKKFGEKLRSIYKAQVIYWDERLTTVAAHKVLIDADISRKKRKGVIDKLAAVLILQSFLDYLHNIDSNGKLL